jgi:uncharacterized membrane protein YphA (DoxX/SURF4 family)
MNSKPVATLVTVATLLLAVLVALAGTGLLTGRAAALVASGILIVNAVLGVIAHGKSTPTANPRNDAGERLVPQPPL